MTEEWKIYKEYDKPWNAKNPKHYIIEVSNFGRVRRNGEIYEIKAKPNKYMYISGGILLHRIVASLFIPNPENKPCVDHIDTNKHNNNVTNLRWCTYSENMYNPITRKRNSDTQKGLHAGEKNPMYGKHHSTITRKKISNKVKGENHPLYGKHRSEETCNKIRDTHKNRYRKNL